jgi:TPR repeat protein
MVNYGMCLQKGIGIQQNLSEAFQWFQRSEKLGQINGIINCIVYLYTGEGIT